jgi:TPP-dependent pyruvate/acetoin dehydrogenase alpha subunit
MLLSDIADRAAAYGIPGVVVDGMDLRVVHAAAGEAIRRARDGGGPTLLECKTYRFMGHSRFEPSSYRTKEELAEWKKRDPIALFRSVLLAEAGASEAEIAQVERTVDEVIEESVRFAEQSPDPAPGDWRRYIFAGENA